MPDRIDIHIQEPRVDYEKLSDYNLGKLSANVQARVEAARERQRVRVGESELVCNADMLSAEVLVGEEQTAPTHLAEALQTGRSWR